MAQISDREIMRIRAELQHDAARSEQPEEYLAGVEDTLRMVRELARGANQARATHRRRQRSGGRML